jgi:hypothetical protein
LRATPEEDLGLDKPAIAHCDELGVAVTLAVLQLVLVQDEDAGLTSADELQDLLRLEPVRRGETAFEERSLVDVVVLRTGEREVLRNEPRRRVPVLSQVRVEARADDVRSSTSISPSRRCLQRFTSSGSQASRQS